MGRLARFETRPRRRAGVAPGQRAYHAATFLLSLAGLAYDLTVTTPVFKRSPHMDPKLLRFFGGSVFYKVVFLTFWNAVS